MEHLEEQYEIFEAEMRRFEGLISQLELWSDECTINHKKEEVKLPQYVEMHLNLEEACEGLREFIESHKETEGDTERLRAYEKNIDEKLKEYKVTEDIIHEWMRAIKNMYILIAKSPVLEKNRSFIEEICK